MGCRGDRGRREPLSNLLLDGVRVRVVEGVWELILKNSLDNYLIRWEMIDIVIIVVAVVMVMHRDGEFIRMF